DSHILVVVPAPGEIPIAGRRRLGSQKRPATGRAIAFDVDDRVHHVMDHQRPGLEILPDRLAAAMGLEGPGKDAILGEQVGKRVDIVPVDMVAGFGLQPLDRRDRFQDVDARFEGGVHCYSIPIRMRPNASHRTSISLPAEKSLKLGVTDPSKTTSPRFSVAPRRFMWLAIQARTSNGCPRS